MNTARETEVKGKIMMLRDIEQREMMQERGTEKGEEVVKEKKGAEVKRERKRVRQVKAERKRKETDK